MTIPISNVLFVCTGNICRSPFAEGLLKKLAQEKEIEGIAVNSAGLLSLPGNPATPLACRTAREYGVDLSGHLAKSLSKELLTWCDLALVMEKSQQNDLLAAFPDAAAKVLLLRHFARHGSRSRGITDPYGLQYDAYRFCFLDIEEAVSGLLAYLSGQKRSFETIRVHCYEGYKANESPRSFEWRGRTYQITKTIDRWYQGTMDERSEIADYFKVQADDAAIYIIRYNRVFGRWAILLG